MTMLNRVERVQRSMVYKSMVGHQVSKRHLQECPEAALLKGAEPILLVHKLLHYFIRPYFQITIFPNIYHILSTTDQVRCYFQVLKRM